MKEIISHVVVVIHSTVGECRSLSLWFLPFFFFSLYKCEVWRQPIVKLFAWGPVLP